jgi:hypothetical protein
MEALGIAGRSKGLKSMDEDEKMIPGNGAAADFLTAYGYKISKSTFAKWSAPSSGVDTAIEGYWGRLPLRRPSRLLELARSRLRPTQIKQKAKPTTTPAADSATAT